MSNLSFISDENLYKHVKKLLLKCSEAFQPMDLTKFNNNLIDPIKLLFDQKVYKKPFDDIIKLEIQRQRDKTISNAIGMFHQELFQYIENCEVPSKGFDVIYTNPNPNTNQKIYVELKNKHNTMNSSSGPYTYMKMRSHIKEYPNDLCCLVEIIAKTSQNIPWQFSHNKKIFKDEKIRRISIDQFYAIITKDSDSFFKLCQTLSKVIDGILEDNRTIDTNPQDTVLSELKKKNPDILESLYLLAFESYNGFRDS